ncbi:hypothetical protein L218DRAFT_989612 [Marasmius fiardii PR-910]|nr:hypothetical protein L218DRAFT_989612 [Marasmius fiardii PR-910]
MLAWETLGQQDRGTRTLLIGEQPNPSKLLPPEDRMSRQMTTFTSHNYSDVFFLESRTDFASGSAERWWSTEIINRKSLRLFDAMAHAKPPTPPPPFTTESNLKGATYTIAICSLLGGYGVLKGHGLGTVMNRTAFSIGSSRLTRSQSWPATEASHWTVAYNTSQILFTLLVVFFRDGNHREAMVDGMQCPKVGYAHHTAMPLISQRQMWEGSG